MDVVENEEETSSDSSTETETGDTDTSSSEGDAENKAGNEKAPLDKHPRWAEREADWNKRFEQQQREFEAKLEALKPKESEEKIKQNTSIPKWFGGNQEQWQDFISFHNQGIEQAEKRAIDRVTFTQTAKEKAIADANSWFEESIKGIEGESGSVVDRNALLKAVIDNELIDSKGRWNYKAGYKILKSSQGQSNSSDRKKLAGDTTRDSGGQTETSPKGVKTSADFKKDRPW